MEPILDRIRKLFRLAGNNPNENEAASAMAKARQLMLEHNIDHLDDKIIDDGQKPVRGTTHPEYDQKWHGFLASAIAVLFNCRFTTNGHGHIAFWGRKDNIQAAEETMAYVSEQIQYFYKLTLKEFGGELSKRQRGDLRQSFKQAAALRVYHRCQEIIATSENRIPDHKALVVINTTKQELDDLFATHGVGRPKGRMKLNTGLGTGAGLAAGDQVKLQKEVRQ